MVYTKPRFSDKEIEKANNIDLLNYIISQGLDFKKVGPASYHIKGYGGLYINSKDNNWYCFSRNKGGGPIQFVMFLKEKTWVEAMKELLGDNFIGTINKPITSINNSQEERKDFILPEKNNTYRHMIAYLIQTRQIDKEIVYELIKEDKLYEDKNRNCVFVGYDRENNPKYANKRGTNTDIAFKGEVKNSDKSHPFYFGDNGDTVYVFESSIDALSHASIYKLKGLDWKSQYRLSLGGLVEMGLDMFLEENPRVKNIILCLDNDEAGHEAERKLLSKYNRKNYNTSLYYIKEKDINDELIKLKKSIALKNDWELEI